MNRRRYCSFEANPTDRRRAGRCTLTDTRAAPGGTCAAYADPVSELMKDMLDLLDRLRALLDRPRVRSRPAPGVPLGRAAARVIGTAPPDSFPELHAATASNRPEPAPLPGFRVAGLADMAGVPAKAKPARVIGAPPFR